MAVGMFDGVHKGHRHVLECLKAYAEREGLEPAVVTFANHPLSVIRPERVPGLICDVNERIDLLLKEGVEDVLVLAFDEELRKLTAGEFAKLILKQELGAEAVVLGYDNTFGSDRLSGADAYKVALSPYGIRVYECDASPEGEVSSTMVRKALAEGDVEEATRLLGRPYTIAGEVVHGREIGRTMGFPTANIAVGEGVMLPKTGVYAGRYKGLPTVVNIGSAPTVTGSEEAPVRVEAYVIAPGENLNLYGQHVEVELSKRLRDERKFGSLDELKAAIEDDVKRAREGIT